MLAVDDATGNGSHTFAGISLHDGANFFREMSYKTWRVLRVIGEQFCRRSYLLLSLALNYT